MFTDAEIRRIMTAAVNVLSDDVRDQVWACPRDRIGKTESFTSTRSRGDSKITLKFTFEVQPDEEQELREAYAEERG